MLTSKTGHCQVLCGSATRTAGSGTCSKREVKGTSHPGHFGTEFVNGSCWVEFGPSDIDHGVNPNPSLCWLLSGQNQVTTLPQWSCKDLTDVGEQALPLHLLGKASLPRAHRVALYGEQLDDNVHCWLTLSKTVSDLVNHHRWSIGLSACVNAGDIFNEVQCRWGPMSGAVRSALLCRCLKNSSGGWNMTVLTFQLWAYLSGFK